MSKRKKKPTRRSRGKSTGPMVVYIMRRSKRDLWAKITGQSEYKIGISSSPNYRKKMISEDIEGEAIIVRLRKIKDAYKVEQKMHRIFADSNFRIRTRGKGQAGSTEWFYLNWVEILCAEYLLWYYYVLPTIRSFLILTLVILFLLIYFFP